MKIPSIKKFGTTALLVLVSIFMTAMFVQGQQVEQESADLDQCRNNADGLTPCAEVGGGLGWFNGNVGFNQGKYAEDEYIPYRMRFDGLTPGTAYVVLLGYDIKNSGAHAIDYLGSYNTLTINRNTNTTVTRANVDPCSGVAGCNLATPSDFVLIPLDADGVGAFTNPNIGGPVFQPNNQGFTMWGGTFTAGVIVNKVAYVPFKADEDPATDDNLTRLIAVRFTPTVANPVLAWSGHIGWAGDWGAGNSAGGINGSPYHMRLKGLANVDILEPTEGGNQDRSLSANAVPDSATLLVRKEVFTPNCLNSSVVPFTFTRMLGAGPGTTQFQLSDSNSSTLINPGAPVPYDCSEVTPGTPVNYTTATFDGTANVVTLTENATSGWTLDIVCTQSGGTNDNVIQLGNRRAIVTLQAFEVVTCTFQNTFVTPTASNVYVAGHTTGAKGVAIPGALVTLRREDTGETKTVVSDANGAFKFEDVIVNGFYRLSASLKGYTFTEMTFSPDDNVTNANLVGAQAPRGRR